MCVCHRADPITAKTTGLNAVTDQQRRRSLTVWFESDTEYNTNRVLNHFQVRYSILACCTTGVPTRYTCSNTPPKKRATTIALHVVS